MKKILLAIIIPALTVPCALALDVVISNVVVASQSETSRQGYTGRKGEIVLNTNLNNVTVYDGKTVGGFSLSTVDQSKIFYVPRGSTAKHNATNLVSTYALAAAAGPSNTNEVFVVLTSADYDISGMSLSFLNNYITILGTAPAVKEIPAQISGTGAYSTQSPFVALAGVSNHRIRGTSGNMGSIATDNIATFQNIEFDWVDFTISGSGTLFSHCTIENSQINTDTPLDLSLVKCLIRYSGLGKASVVTAGAACNMEIVDCYISDLDDYSMGGGQSGSVTLYAVRSTIIGSDYLMGGGVSSLTLQAKDTLISCNYMGGVATAAPVTISVSGSYIGPQLHDDVTGTKFPFGAGGTLAGVINKIDRSVIYPGAFVGASPGAAYLMVHYSRVNQDTMDLATDAYSSFNCIIETWQSVPEPATSISIADAGAHYTGTEVEAALQEAATPPASKVTVTDAGGFYAGTDAEAVLQEAATPAASRVTVTDAGGYYTGTDVEAILQEAAVPFADYTSGVITINAADAYGAVIMVDGNWTVTLPDVAEGMSITVMTYGSGAVTLDVDATDWSVVNGVDGTAAGDDIVSPAGAGDHIVLHGIDVLGTMCWVGYTVGSGGAWTN